MYMYGCVYLVKLVDYLEQIVTYPAESQMAGHRKPSILFWAKSNAWNPKMYHLKHKSIRNRLITLADVVCDENFE